MGECAVCGESFMKEVLMNLCSLDKGNIQSFDISFIQQTLYAHAPDCVNKLKDAFKAMKRAPKGFRNDMLALHDSLPEGPLKKALKESIDKAETDEHINP